MRLRSPVLALATLHHRVLFVRRFPQDLGHASSPPAFFFCLCLAVYTRPGHRANHHSGSHRVRDPRPRFQQVRPQLDRDRFGRPVRQDPRPPRRRLFRASYGSGRLNTSRGSERDCRDSVGSRVRRQKGGVVALSERPRCDRFVRHDFADLVRRSRCEWWWWWWGNVDVLCAGRDGSEDRTRVGPAQGVCGRRRVELVRGRDGREL